MSPSQLKELHEGGGVYYVTQEAALCPGIAGGADGWPDVIPHPTNRNARLVKRVAIRLEDGSDQPPQEYGPGAGWGKNKHKNDDIHGQLTRAPHLPTVPQKMSEKLTPPEPGTMSTDLPDVLEKHTVPRGKR